MALLALLICGVLSGIRAAGSDNGQLNITGQTTPLIAGKPAIQIEYNGWSWGGGIVPAQAFAHTGEQHNYGPGLSDITSDYIVDKDVKFIKAHFVISGNRQHKISPPHEISLDLPITSTDGVKWTPIGDGLRAFAVLLEPMKLSPPAKTNQNHQLAYYFEMVGINIPEQLRDHFQTLQKSGRPMDIFKESKSVKVSDAYSGEVDADEDPPTIWVHGDVSNFMVQATSATPDVIYLKGTFDSMKYETSIPVGEHIQVFAGGKTQEASSDSFNVMVVRAVKTKPGFALGDILGP